MFDLVIDVWVKLCSALFFTSQRMRTEYNCPVVAGKPKVAFKETIGKEARYELNVTPMCLFQLIDVLHSSVSFMSNRELRQSRFWATHVYRRGFFLLWPSSPIPPGTLGDFASF